MKPATTYPARRDDVRLLVIDPRLPRSRTASPDAALRETRTPALPDFLAAGDLLVVNDAATVPASLRGRDSAGSPIEARLIAARGDDRFGAVLFGPGDWHQRTEDRPPPAPLPVGARLQFGALAAEVVARAPASPRLVELRFAAAGDALWAALYRAGRPVQYSYLAHDLPLWAVQTVYAARPWAFEMPSAGRPLSWEILLALRRKGVRWASLTHAAGLSSTGDPAIDAALPLAERYDIPAATVRAVAETRARNGRVVAAGTTVVRALEGAAARDGGLRAGPAETDLIISPAFRPRVVDGILSGAHAAHESHFSLLAAFAGPELLAAAADHAERAGFLTHELGDAMLVLPGALAAQAARGAGASPTR
jgi:S-adenosylmethionine:tRNA ribosyltransferase-isomerase